MTAQWRQRVWNWFSQAIIALVVVFLTFSLTQGTRKEVSLDKALEEKATYTYVDSKDEEIKDIIDMTGEQHDKDIESIKALIKQQNDYLQIIIKDRLASDK
jgi:hypothetical protein